MMLEGVRGLAERLESAPASLAWAFDHKPAETHNSVPHRSIYDGLEWLFSAWDIAPAEFVGVTGGDRLSRIDARFDEVSEHYGYAIETPEAFLSALGSALLSAGDIPGAVEVLEAAVERYPESPAVYDGVGDAYDAAGDTERAEASYREAWTRARDMGHPDAAVFKEHLDRVVGTRVVGARPR
jgi:tetratricopeptide (TPR) repeat protein